MSDHEASSSPSFIEAKLPLWWILASVTAICVSAGGVFVKLDSLSLELNKITSKLDAQEIRISQFSENLSDVKSTNRVQQMQIDRATVDLSEISRYNRVRTP